MNHADPWDEMARLERQMEVELLTPHEAPALESAEDRPGNEPAPTDVARRDPRL